MRSCDWSVKPHPADPLKGSANIVGDPSYRCFFGFDSKGGDLNVDHILHLGSDTDSKKHVAALYPPPTTFASSPIILYHVSPALLGVDPDRLASI